MKKILIVDDQSLNQTLLESYLEQYCQINHETMSIALANNGLEAVLMCEETPFDLIFMDILMPSMDGIEATRRINAMLPEAIIVIVSTEDDEENQIKALRNGAKDYCIKPIQPDLFKRRIKLYLNMLNTKKGVPSYNQAINVFTNDIFCFKTSYLIENEEDLTQLWESLMFNLRDSVRTNHLSDLIRFIYQIGLSMLARKVQPQIILEENEHSYFFSVLNVNILTIQKIEQLIQGYFRSQEYHIHSNTLSFKMEKILLNVPVTEQARENPKDEISVVSHTTEIPVYEKASIPLQTFDFMDEEDVVSLELRLNELSTQFMWMGGNELESNDVDQLINAFEKVSSILGFYIDTQTIGYAIRDLAELIKNDEAGFIQKAPQMAALCKSFNNDMILWFKTIFFEGAPSIDYMDASIISNIRMIRSFLEPEDTANTDETDGLEFF